MRIVNAWKIASSIPSLDFPLNDIEGDFLAYVFLALSRLSK